MILDGVQYTVYCIQVHSMLGYFSVSQKNRLLKISFIRKNIHLHQMI